MPREKQTLPPSPTAGGGTTLGTTVFHHVRDDILKGAFLPRQQLRIDLMSERYGTSSTSVREALNRLAAVGLVDYSENRGFFVASIDLDEVDDLFRTFCWLEERALRESIQNRTPDGEERIVIAFHRLSRFKISSQGKEETISQEWETAHRDFHRSLIAECRSHRLLGFCEQLYFQTYRYRNLAFKMRYRDRNLASEHQRIMQFVLDGEVEAAVQLLMAHYERTAESIRAFLEASSNGKDE